MEKKYFFVRAFLWFICFYHVLIGVTLNLSGELSIKLAKILAGLTVKGSPELAYLAKPFGVYIICFGLMMGLSAWNPVKNRAMITLGVLLFVIRAAQRIMDADTVQQLFSVPAGRNQITVGIVLLFALLLAGLRTKIYFDMKKSTLTQ